jgi:hypothetical protein
MRGGRWRSGALGSAILLIAGVALAQFGRGRLRFDEPEQSGPEMPVREAEFHFLRLEYTDLPQFQRGFGFRSRNGKGRGWWLQDWPDADDHFTSGIQRLTRLDVGDPRHVSLLDDRLFDYPWIYATQTGYWDLSDAEVLRLREYLQRGGFLMVDDFWGQDWEWFRETMERVLPGRSITDIAESDAVMRVLYEIRDKDRTFIPGSRHLALGAGGTVRVIQPAGTEPAWRAISDDRNRVLVAVNYNTDIGDAWEFADVPYYPAEMTLLAYRYGINYIIYSMTH